MEPLPKMPQAAVPVSAVSAQHMTDAPSTSDKNLAERVSMDLPGSSTNLKSHRPAQKTISGMFEEYLTRLDDGHPSGKRAVSGGDVSRKRQKTTASQGHVSSKDAEAPIPRSSKYSNISHPASPGSFKHPQQYTTHRVKLGIMHQGMPKNVPGMWARPEEEGKIMNEIEKAFNYYRDQNQDATSSGIAASSEPDEMSQNGGKPRHSLGDTTRLMDPAGCWKTQGDTRILPQFVRPSNPEPASFSRNAHGNPYQVENVLGGLMLPANYDMTKPVGTGKPWICPIRSCQYQFKRKATLAKHWKKHRKCLLNDNNDGTFSIKGEYLPRRVRKANALVVSQEPLDPSAALIAPLPPRPFQNFPSNTTDSQEDISPPKEVGVGTEDVDEVESTVSTESDAESVASVRPSHVIISTDPEMATNLRAYNSWPDDLGNLAETSGALLPANYRLCVYPDFEWICPVRSCRRVMQSLEALSSHFVGKHSFTLFNDNRDGTFTALGHHTGGLAPIVVSKNPIDPNTPMKDPNVDPRDFGLQHDFVASQALWQADELKRLRARKPPEEGKTVDQVMAEKDNADGLQIEPDAPPSLNRSPVSALNPVPSSSDSEISFNATSKYIDDLERVNEEEAMSGAEAMQEKEAPKSAKQESKTSNLTTTAAQENWATIEALFTEKRLPPPRSDPIRTLLSCPRVRELQFPTSQKFSVAWPKDVSLLIVQLVGDESPTPCSRCAKGLGILRGCVVLSNEVAQVIQQGRCSCVNCAWKSSNLNTCDLVLRLQEQNQAANEQTVSPVPDAQPSLPAQEAIDQLDVVEDSSQDRLRPLRARRSERLVAERTTKKEEPKPQPASHDDTPPVKAPTQTRSVTPKDDGVGAQGTKVQASTPVSRMANVSRSIQVDERFTFGTHIIPPGTSLQLDADLGSLCTCTLAVGKVTIRVQGEPAFRIGSQGMFKITSGGSGQVVNTSGIDAVLHVFSIRKGR